MLSLQYSFFYSCKRSHKCWLNIIPMSWIIRLSFFLITMTQHFCDHLGYSSCYVSSIWWMRMNDLPFPLICRNGSLSMQGCFCRRNAGKARISFLDALRRTSFLVARASFSFFMCFIFYWSKKVFEQFVTGPELFFVNMNFIHKMLCFSGCNNVRCGRWICNWWYRNFYSRLVKNFYNMNFQNWSNNCAFGNSCQDLGFRIRSRTRVFSVQRSNCSPSVVRIWSNFVFSPAPTRYWKLAFSHNCMRFI